MKEIGAYEAKTHLPKLLDEVARGERITITKHGVPVAMLVPMPSSEIPDAAIMMASIKRFRKKLKLKGTSIRDLRDEGKRY